MQNTVIALTGGVASGKSSVARHFALKGINVHDADEAARRIVDPSSEGLAAIVAAFGTSVLDADKCLDRAAMRQRIFTDPTARQALESITHPRIRQWLMDRVMADRGPYCVVAIPLLVESLAHYSWINRVLVVDAPESTQLARLLTRDGIDEALARRMLAAQATRAQRLAIADDIIDNSGEESALDAQVAALHEKYLALAVARR
jgi:dephospho-CoA kinase